MLIYKVAGANGFNPLAPIFFLVSKEYWFFVDNATRRYMALSTIFFSILMLAFAMFSLALGSGLSSNSNNSMLFSGLVFVYFAVSLPVFQPKVVSAKTLPKRTEVMYSWLYMCEWVFAWLLILTTLQLNALNMLETIFATPLQAISLFALVMLFMPPMHIAYAKFVYSSNRC